MTFFTRTEFSLLLRFTAIEQPKEDGAEPVKPCFPGYPGGGLYNFARNTSKRSGSEMSHGRDVGVVAQEVAEPCE